MVKRYQVISLFLSSVALSLGLVGSYASANSVTVAQQPNCNNPQSQSEMNICAQISYDRADKKLNQVYKQVMSKFSGSQRQQLINAQIAWVKFRDADCAFNRDQFKGGSMAPLMFYGCMGRLTQERTKHIQEYLQVSQR